MASRPILPPFAVISNGDMSTILTSKVTVIQNLSMLSYALSWAGASPAGSVSVQASNDYAQDASGAVQNAGTWTTLPLSASTLVSGNTGTGFIDIDSQAGYALRLVYTPASGIGTLQVVANGKVA